MLKIDSIAVDGNQTGIQFNAVAGKTYSVLYRDDLSSGLWLQLAAVPAQDTNGVVTIYDPTMGAAAARFYRIVTPAQP